LATDSDAASLPEIIGVTANNVKTARVAAANAKLRRSERREFIIKQNRE